MTKTFCPTFDKQSQIVERIVCELLLFRAVWSGPLSTPSHSSTAACQSNHLISSMKVKGKGLICSTLAFEPVGG